MQLSTARHSSAISMELTAPLTSSVTGSDVLSAATCTGHDSGSIWEEAGDATSTIDSGSAHAAMLSVAVSLTNSVVGGTSALTKAALATAALPISGAGGVAASWASAVGDGARRSSIGIAPAFSMPAEPKWEGQATTQAARTT